MWVTERSFLMFYAMYPSFCAGLSHAVFKGILKKGYKIPTPIQRKVVLYVHVQFSSVQF